MDGEYKKALERIEILEKELSRIKQAIIALAEGQPAGEYMKFDTSAFLEENEIWSESYSALAHMMDKLLEIKYCTYYLVIEDLEKECGKWREEARMYTGWGSHREDTLLIEYLLEEFQDIYEYGIQGYKWEAKEHPDLRDMVGLLPEHCPWTLEELMENEDYELLNKLPEREKRM